MIRRPSSSLSRRAAVALIAGALALASPPASANGSGAFWAVFGAFTALALVGAAAQPTYVYVPAYAYPAPVYYAYPAAPVAAVPVVATPGATPLAANPASSVYQAADGRLCREFEATVIMAGAAQPVHGTACLGPDGVWRVAN
jgi:hypothetical protein